MNNNNGCFQPAVSHHRAGRRRCSGHVPRGGRASLVLAARGAGGAGPPPSPDVAARGRAAPRRAPPASEGTRAPYGGRGTPPGRSTRRGPRRPGATRRSPGSEEGRNRSRKRVCRRVDRSSRRARRRTCGGTGSAAPPRSSAPRTKRDSVVELPCCGRSVGRAGEKRHGVRDGDLLEGDAARCKVKVRGPVKSRCDELRRNPCWSKKKTKTMHGKEWRGESHSKLVYCYQYIVVT